MDSKSNGAKAGASAAGAAPKATRSTTRAAAVKPARRAAARAEPAAEAEAEPAGTAPARQEAAQALPALKKAELLDAVVVRSGVKKGQAKPVVEALLAVLGETVGEGRDLNLEPFGKLKIKRSETGANGRVTVARLRQKDGPPRAPAEDPDG